MRKIISIVLLVCVLFSAIPAFALSDVTAENVALNKKVTASTYLAGYGPENLTDGNIYSGWSAGTGVNHSVTVDLTKEYKIEKIVIEMRKDYNQPETRCGFEVRASNEPNMANYVVLGAQGSVPIEHGGRFIADVVNDLAFRYVQVIKTDGRYFFINEIMVYGSEDTGSKMKEVPAYEDMAEHALNEKVKLLSMLDVINGYDDNTFRPEKAVTRVEASKMIVNFLRMSNSGAVAQVFDDVPLSYWGAEPVGILSAMGAISGVGGGNFEPEERVTYAQFIKILLSALGYDTFAQMMGGYPSGYLSVASRCKITLSGVDTDEIITREKAAEILYKALDMPVSKPVGMADDEIIYEVKEDNSILNSTFKTVKYRGVVEATEYSALNGSGKLAKDYIKIGGRVYRTSMDTFMLLGRKVDSYIIYSEDMDEEIVLYCSPVRTDDELIVPADKIVPGTDKFELSYYSDDSGSKSKLAKIERPTDVFVNEKYQIDWNGSTIRPQNGFVRLVDGDDNGLYETVAVYSFDTLIVSNVASSGNLVSIFGLWGNSAEFDMDDAATRVRLTDKDGKRISLSALEKNDVVSVYKSADDDFVWVRVTDETVSGTVEAIKDNAVVINGAEIDLSVNYNSALANGRYGVGKINPGEETVLYLDVEGKVANAGKHDETVSGTLKYGYLATVKIETGIAEELYVLMTDTAGALKKFKCSSKIRLNGTKETSAAIRSSLAGTAENGTYGQLVRYRMDSKGEVVDIYTALNTSEEYGIRKENVNDSYGNAINTQTTEYYYHAPTVGMYRISGGGTADFFVSDSTVMITVPRFNSADVWEMNNPNHYAQRDKNGIANYGHYYAEGYNCNKVGIAEVILNYIEATTSDDGSGAYKETHGPVLLVDDIGDALSPDGEVIKRLYAYENGERKTFDFHEKVDMSNFRFIKVHSHSENDLGSYPVKALQRGDIIRCKVDGNMITSAIVLFSDSDPFTNANTVGTSWDHDSIYPSATRTVSGVIKEIYGDYMVFAKGNPAGGINTLATEKYNFTTADVYLYDTQEEKIVVLDRMEIPLYTYSAYANSRVFMRTLNGALDMVLIVK